MISLNFHGIHGVCDHCGHKCLVKPKGDKMLCKDCIMRAEIKENELVMLSEDVVGCEKCDLCNERNKVVFGEGHPDAYIMFIGEAPGANEDKFGRPFIGRAGSYLTKLLVDIDLHRDEVYITNIVKCRPPNNRKPTVREKNHCMPYLKKQIEIISPRIIVTLGGTATEMILDESISITKVNGIPVERNSRIIIPCIHPAAGIRNANYKPQIEEAFQVLDEQIAKVTNIKG